MTKRAASAAGLLVILIGTPIALFEFGGPPALTELPDLEGLRRAVELRWVPVEWALRVLTLVGWALWAYLLVAVLLRVLALVQANAGSRGRLWATSEAMTWGPVRLLVDLSVGAALLSSSLIHEPAQATREVSRSQSWASTIGSQLAAMREGDDVELSSNGSDADTARKGLGAGGSSHDSKPASARSKHTYVVRLGDSLWSIAEKQLHDPYRWVDIWRLNRGREMPDGERLSRPGFVRPGWRLQLPDDKDKQHRLEDGKKNAVSNPSPENKQANSQHHRSDEKPKDPASHSSEPNGTDTQETSRPVVIRLPSGTVVATSFVAGLLVASALARMRARWRRAPRPLSSGWPSARLVNDLKSRLLRVAARETSDEEQEPRTFPELTPADDRFEPSSIVIGHRDRSPVHLGPTSEVYWVSGDESEVDSYFRDLAAHSLVSYSKDVEVWSTPSPFEDVPGLRSFGDTRTLVSELEIEVLKRHRLLDEEGLEDWSTHQANWPDDPLPLVLTLIVGAEPELGNRLAAVAAQGQELGLVIFAQGSLMPIMRLEGGLVHPLALAEETLGRRPFSPVHLAESDLMQALNDLRRAAGDIESDEPTVEEQDLQSAPVGSATVDGPIQVHLFGPPEILARGRDVSGNLRRKTRELLVFFLLHPQGAGREQIIETLWPEMDAERAYERFWFQLSDLRRGLRNDSQPTAKFIDRSGDVYRVQPEIFDVDVWRFDELLGKAASGEMVQESLQAATDLYREELLQGVYYEWAEPLRTHFQGQLLDALVQLAQTCEQEGDAETAVTVLVRAISLDPYAEQIYRKLMGLYAKLGRATDIQRSYRELEAALSEGLDAEPTEETSQLRDTLIRQLSQDTEV